MKKYLPLLLNIPLFSGISEAELASVSLCLKGTVRSFLREEFIRLEEDPADFIGIVLEGEIRILQEDLHGNRSLQASLEAGDMFAEAFALAGISGLPVSILAASDCRILFLDKQHILSP